MRRKVIIKALSSQVLPTTLRGQGMAVVLMMSMVSKAASPLIVYSVSCFFWFNSTVADDFFFSEQAVREGSMDHHLADCHNCQCPR